MAATIAREPYFFCVRLIASTAGRFPLVVFFANDFDYLSVGYVGAPDDAQNREDRYENTPEAEPLVDIETDKKAEADAPGHGQAELHHDGEIFSPWPVFFVVKKHVPPIKIITG